MTKRTNQGMMDRDLYGEYKGHKYSRRRKILQQSKKPWVQFGRKWTKATPWGKAKFIAIGALPKLAIVGAGYLGAKAATKKKEQPKKYMAG